MEIRFTKKLKKKLLKRGFHCIIKGKIQVSPDVKFELPCDIGNVNLSMPLEVGAYTYIGAGFDNRASVKIGRLCSVATGLKIINANHPMDTVSSSPFFSSNDFYGWNKLHQSKIFVENPEKSDRVFDVIIEDDVWIGVDVKIVGSGITIGKGAILGAGAIVTKSVAPYNIVVGIPAKPIKTRKIKPYSMQKDHQKIFDEIVSKNDFSILTPQDFQKEARLWNRIINSF